MNKLEQQILDFISDPDYKPVKRNKLSSRLNLADKLVARHNVALQSLIDAGKVFENKRGRLKLKSALQTIAGVIKRTSSGAGFVIPHDRPSDGRKGDIYVAPADMGDAYSGDEVLVQLLKGGGHGGRRTGRIEEVVERATSTFVGTYFEDGGNGFVRVDGTTFNDPIFVGDPGAKGAQPDDKVVIEMVRFPTHFQAGEAVLTTVLGARGEVRIDTLSIVHEFGLPTEFSDDVLAEVWIDFKANMTDQRLRNILIERYLPLVKYNAERVWQKLPEGVDMNDLISAGVFGLMDAIEAFDMERGVKFETYCVPRIRGAMLDELRTMDWVPRLVRSKASKLEAARKRVEARFGRPPTDAELAQEMEVSLEEFEKVKSDASAVNLVSLNKKWYETDSYKDVREVDIIEDSKGEDPTRGIQKRDVMRLVTRGLNRNERLIIILYYYEELTMKEIGSTLGLSESRVSQMHSSIVARLKDQLNRRRPEFA